MAGAVGDRAERGTGVVRGQGVSGESGCDRGQRAAAGLRRLRHSGRCGDRAEGTEEPRALPWGALGRSRSE